MATQMFFFDAFGLRCLVHTCFLLKTRCYLSLDEGSLPMRDP